MSDEPNLDEQQEQPEADTNDEAVEQPTEEPTEEAPAEDQEEQPDEEQPEAEAEAAPVKECPITVEAVDDPEFENAFGGAYRARCADCGHESVVRSTAERAEHELRQLCHEA